MRPLELIHGDLVGPMPVESVSRCRYGFILVDDYLRAGWVLPLRAKSDTPRKFKLWVSLLENGTSRRVKTVMFDNAGELVAGRMREICDERGIHIISSVPHSPSSNGVAERLVGVATSGTRAMLRDSGLPPQFWAEAMATFMYLRNRTPTTANDGKTPFKRFYDVVPDVSHICVFGCVVCVTLPKESLGKLDQRAAMGYLLGYKYEGAYRVWIPKVGVRECRDVVFYEGEAPVMPDDNVVTVQVPNVAPPPPPIRPTYLGPVPNTKEDANDNAPNDALNANELQERLTIQIPSKFHPRRSLQPQPAQGYQPQHEPMEIDEEGVDNVPQYVGRVHKFPARSMRSGLVCNSGGEGALIAFGAFEEVPAFAPTPMMPDPQTVSQALEAPDADEWAAAMDNEITNMLHLGVFREIPHPDDKNIITPKWVFCRKFKDGLLVKHKARLVA